jgi:phosphate transport system substrate-binding protein
MKMKRLALYISLAAAVSIAAWACNSSTADDSTGGKGPQTTGSSESPVSGPVLIDGSTTVYPIVLAMGEDFRDANKGVEMTVNKAGTGSGFKKFIAGETDIATASRPIDAKENDELKAKSIDYIEVPIAYDGLTIIIHPDNTWAKSMTMDQLKKAWAPGSTVATWADINPAWPKEKINFYGPSDNHGTYEYFTEAVAGKKGSIRDGYQPNQEYNAVVQAVGGDKNAIGYVGFNYFEENKDKVKAVTINGVAPSSSTIENGTYTPLSRPLFIYVRKDALENKPQVKAFVEYALNAGLGAVTEAQYVQLPKDVYDTVKANLKDMKTGSLFLHAKPGMPMKDVLAKENGGDAKPASG